MKTPKVKQHKGSDRHLRETGCYFNNFSDF